MEQGSGQREEYCGTRKIKNKQRRQQRLRSISLTLFRDILPRVVLEKEKANKSVCFPEKYRQVFWLLCGIKNLEIKKENNKHLVILEGSRDKEKEV